MRNADRHQAAARAHLRPLAYRGVSSDCTVHPSQMGLAGPRPCTDHVCMAEYQNSDDRSSSTHRALHVTAESGTPTWLSGDVYTIKIGALESGGSMTVLEASVPPGAGPPMHRHADADEAFYILSGELEVTAAGTSYRARSGDFVFIPRGTPHRFHNSGLHTVRQLLVFTPAGIEGFFREAGQSPVPGRPAPPPEQEDLQAVARVGEKYRLYQESGHRLRG